MTGLLCGLLLGAGLFTAFSACWVPSPRVLAAASEPRPGRVREALAQAEVRGVAPGAFAGACAACAAVAGSAALLLTGVWSLGACAAVIAGWAPWGLVRWRGGRRRVQVAQLWPDAVDNLASAVRAGLSLPEAVAALGERGPEELRPPFARFALRYRTSGAFEAELDVLKEELADPVADRLLEALRMTRQVGGSDLGRLLRTLSAFLREDARVRGELQARQSWTVNGARLAVAAPWVVLALLASRPEAVRAYDSAAGSAVLAGGAAGSLLAYRLMLAIGRLPVERRVLR
ncbi:tight adherence protein B [Kineococcus xinjiangensis]|uniref:Tight adherence protein B n=1 Tax=Kineococcus xinjiangensis TaxID=512762 RepID=A0A2S6ICX9_9ACTN|nr:type II secretion system F family protein [Kineococcus xinjiangensis]PPK92020.1 tight adherence protein B [Kineococcus xinjiangensis]